MGETECVGMNTCNGADQSSVKSIKELLEEDELSALTAAADAAADAAAGETDGAADDSATCIPLSKEADKCEEREACALAGFEPT
jgi:hypothetical protein